MPIDPATAFVSYSREDLEFVTRLAKDLKAKGANVWMDRLDIRAGQPWDDAVEAAVDQCGHMLVILSPASIASQRVKNEFIDALDQGKVVIPVLFCECKIPMQLKRLQYADFRADYASGIDELLTSLGPNLSRTEKEIRELDRRAQAGDADAMVDLGLDYAMGERVEQDQARAVALFRKAAEAGNAEGMFQLGVTYRKGFYGVESDPDQATIWLRRAAEKGHSFAMLELAEMFESGEGVAVDYAEARKWYNHAANSRPDEVAAALGRLTARETAQKAPQGEIELKQAAAEKARLEQEERERKADEDKWLAVERIKGMDPKVVDLYRKAQAGDSDAMNELGSHYYYGSRVSEDYLRAAAWYRKAADAGNPKGMTHLAYMYANGCGIEKDQQQAIFWYRKAAALGDPTAKHRLKRLAENP